MNFTPFVNHPTNASWFKRALQSMTFLGAYLIFAVVGSVSSVACVLPAVVFRGVHAHQFGQRLIHGLFAFFVGYLRRCGLLKLEAGELAALRNSRGLIFVANHPCLLDAVLIVSQLPQIVCLMKGSLARNIVLCGTAKLAGYVHNESGLGLVRKCEERLRQGANLLIFPEGTRSIGGQMQSFKMGFALIACKAQSPVQTVIITADSNYLGKGWPFFRRPPFPLRYSLRLGKQFVPTSDMDAKSFGSMVEDYYRHRFARHPGPAVSLPP
jgi:1-acyl-sn-glycerol-3-phosphate acyltransferase